ncbi:MAG: FAD-binding oxidoreductase [Bacteroidia bacterium]
MQCDFIIVGGGLAGMSLAFRLLKRGKTIMLYNWREEKAASRVAAGLMNPVVFKRITKGWRSDEFLKESELFYPELEKLLGARFYIKPDFYRIHGSDYERNFWTEMSESTQFSTFLGPPAEDEKSRLLKAPFGISFLNGASAVISEVFLIAAKNYLLEQDSLINERVEFNQIEFSPEGVKYKDISAAKIVYCTGAQAAVEGHFNYLPFKIAKGEVLTVQCEIPEMIFNGKVYGVPVSPGIFKIGSTYGWEQKDDFPTEEGRAEISGNLDKILKPPYTILEHEAGFRPTVKDRRPFLGLSKTNSKIAIFNGLGTKGYLMAPLLSLEMCDFLCDGKPLDPESNVSRCKIK